MSRTLILVVDDNPVNAKLLRVVLEDEGYMVGTAEDAETALRFLETSRPRIILMDVQLPGTDGLELTRRLKRDPVHSKAVIIAVTANAMKGDAERAIAAGCDDYVSKPIDLVGFLETIDRHLAG